MGDPFDFFIDESGWPYPDEGDDGDERRDRDRDQAHEPADVRFGTDEDAVALHALTPQVLARLSRTERAAVVARFGLDGHDPMTMAELSASLGVSRDRARVALFGGLTKLRSVLGEGSL
jgi:DNA-directed RNA polymerase sigma subunit (sigma70/sigma32)